MSNSKSAQGQHLKNLGLASLGAVLEYFDFVVYVYVAAAVSRAFFPPDASPWVSQVQTFGIYAFGYLVRPLAGIAIAHFADRIGRKKLFLFTVLLMSVPTFLMGCLPTYEQVGWYAPVALLVLRLLQGCAVGGEIPGASVFISEHAAAHRLGLASGTFQGIVNCGLLLGAAAASVSALIASLDPSMSSLAWRLPFIFGGIFGLMAAYLRRHLSETPLFVQIREERTLSKQTPLSTVVREHRRACLFALALVFCMSSTSGVYFQYLPNYLITEYGFTQEVVFRANIVGVIAFVLAMPLWGMLRDKAGVGRTLAAGAAANAAVCVWFFANLGGIAHSGTALALSLIPVGLAGGCVHSLIPGTLSALFPTAIRQSGFALPYSIGTAIFTGLTPLALAWLVRDFGLQAPMYFFLVACVVAAVAAVAVRSVPMYLGRQVAAAAPVHAPVSKTAS
jgi:MFS family permease